MGNPAVLIAESDQILHQDLTGPLFEHGIKIIEALDNADINQIVREKKPGLVLIESSRCNKWNGLKEAKKLRNRNSKVPIVLVTRQDQKTRIVQALGDSIKDYIIASFPEEKLIDIIKLNLYGNEDNNPLKSHNSIMVGDSISMNENKNYIMKVAPTDCTVLVTGETGTGKELAAQMIHHNSKRHNKPFVCINCAALPDSLLESELFGYERGTFTGAHSSYPGKLLLAGKGSVFLDEIGDMSINAQTKILRAIETREIYPLGSKKGFSMDARIIAATNQDLEKLMEEGLFRADLYFRLNVVRIELPPLRKRKEDILPLLVHFIQIFNKQYGVGIKGVTKETLNALLKYHWPGNVREFKNILEASYINLPSDEITFSDLPKIFIKKINEMEKLSNCEREKIISTLAETGWNKSKAADKLNWSRMTLYRKMARYNIVKSKKNLD
jgi:DNA-binding NtrC family response regulator